MRKFLGLVVISLVFTATIAFCEQKTGEKPMKDEKFRGPNSSCEQKGDFKRGKEFKHDMGDRRAEIISIKRYIRLKEKLNLTDEQVGKLEKIGLDYEKDNIRREADMQILRIELGEIIRKDKPDFSAAREKIKKISELQLESKLKMIDCMEDGYNVLTKEQQNKLLQLKEERKEKSKENIEKKEEK
ncbi:MAG: hypothetical protein A2539_08220 [Elusimicrobia bacterium RIFOXYD2_FULL_34_15]|nr:MAG: hypothetical protein A2539_08220 [Elusimicrobia bacterium RIFOXYD2_FULL_34_15]